MLPSAENISKSMSFEHGTAPFTMNGTDNNGGNAGNVQPGQQNILEGNGAGAVSCGNDSFDQVGAASDMDGLY